jgi:hypothetical protein
MSRRPSLTQMVFCIACTVLPVLASAQTSTTPVDWQSNEPSSKFQVKLDAGAITGLKNADDKSNTEYLIAGRRLGDVVLRYRIAGGDLQEVQTAKLARNGEIRANFGPASREHSTVYTVVKDKKDSNSKDKPEDILAIHVTLALSEQAILWKLNVRNLSDSPVEIADLAVPLPLGSSFGRNGRTGTMILKHSFISGHGSFLFWTPGNSASPSLVLTPLDNTSLEYWNVESRGMGGGYSVFIHSAAAGAVAKEKGCNWRQPHTSLTIAPKGSPGDCRQYGFKFQWAEDYDTARKILVEGGKIDVHVVPGMTVPSDLNVRVALVTRQKINAVEAEFPDSTQIKPLDSKDDRTHVYQISFSKLGENRLKISYGDDRHMFLEFFCTEPIEALIKKRAAFIARCQHRDPDKWYNGLISEWNMETRILLGPDNYDRISGFRIYEVSCDDPGLCKPAFLAAKNAEHPLQNEVDVLDYYIQHFVWGGLQRTTDETYSYGIYGIPDWKKNRDSRDPGRNGKLHLWRIYDYSHVVLMYFSMYRTAKYHPQIKTAMKAEEYLQRAYGTALAMFTVPNEIEKWEAYGTGLYNELIIPDLIGELQAAGMNDQANRLREHWERKVRTFVNDKPDLFQSEYPFDSTGFEATHALAKYAIKHADTPAAENKIGITPEKAREFMQKQIASNIFCRGWLEPAYYLLGSDYRGSAGNSYTLSYMSQMGGWSVLDYGLYFAGDPSPYLRLGYASFLSSWALMNTGTPESNYGYWYPGKENDGGAGGGFEPAAFGMTWLGQPHHRGSWYYSCEIDLGYCGALRTAATILTDDPIFGRICLGGDWLAKDEGIYVNLKDGLRKRFHAMLDEGRLHLVLDNDRFAASEPIFIKQDFSEMHFTLETDNPERHSAKLHTAGLPSGKYSVGDNQGSVAIVEVLDGKDREIDLRMDKNAGSKHFVIARQAGN